MECKDIISRIKEKAYENVNKKIEEEREATESKIKNELKTIERCVEFIEKHLVFKKVNGNYVLATSDMFFYDYSKQPKYSYNSGVKIKENRRIYEPWFTVNGESYYEIRYIIGKYEEDFSRLTKRAEQMYETIRGLEESWKTLEQEQKSIKSLLEQYGDAVNKELYSYGEVW